MSRRSRPHQGIVRFRTEGYNQDGTVVIEFKRTVLIYKAGHVPQVPRAQRVMPHR